LDFRLGYGVFGNPSSPAKVIHLTDASDPRRPDTVEVAVRGDLPLVLRGLVERLARTGTAATPEWAEGLRAADGAARDRDGAVLASTADPIHPARIYGELLPRLADDAVTIGDGGDFVSFAGKYIEPAQPGCWLDPGPFGCLGTGLGYAIGARVARPGAQVTLLLGDGAAGFSLMDVDTLVRHDLPVVMVMGNNSGWGLERGHIHMLHGYGVPTEHPPTTPYDEVVLEVKNWNAHSQQLGRDVVKDANFNLKKGEIVGFAGLMGSGRTELALSLFGNSIGYQVKGDLYLNGQKQQFKQPEDAIRAGLAYVTEDRKAKGLILTQDVKQNITLANLREIARRGVVDDNAEVKVANEYRVSLNIKTPSVEQKVKNLSGGNQQKVSLGKWLFVKPNILILDEPTRGIDVGATFEIYTLMNGLVEQGMSIIMLSSELPEVLGMSDRVYVVASGRIAGELPIEEATQEKIMELATG
jgi:ABC-type multidrug transport system ATPase subunit